MRIVVLLLSLGPALWCTGQADSTVMLRLALLGGSEMIGTDGFRGITDGLGLPPPSANTFRKGLGMYCAGKGHLRLGYELLLGSGRSYSDSASALSYFFSMELHLGYAVVRTPHFEVTPTMGYRTTDYSYQADQNRYNGPFPQVSYMRPHIAAGVYAHYGGRVCVILHAGTLIALNDGHWTNDLNGQRLTDGPAMHYPGFVDIGIGFALKRKGPKPGKVPEADDEE